MQSKTLQNEEFAELNKKTIFGHPIGLMVLFLTEMWERFSFYGMRALLVLYMTDYLLKGIEAGKYVFGFETLKMLLENVFGPLAIQPMASQLYGLYTGFVYFTPFFGGLLADRVLGQRKTVLVGGLLMAIGHFLMAIESLFLVALVFLILGNGCFKPNISTQVGSLYPQNDPRRDGAYTIFYMGINLGAFFSPFICGTLGQVYGWHYGFGAAGVGMIIGLITYMWGQKYLAKDMLTKKHEAHKNTNEKITGDEWKAIIGLCVLCTLNIIFWGVYEQQGNTIQLFADRNTDMSIFGWQMPSSWFQALNPAFIILCAPFLDKFWVRRAKKGKSSSSISKMGFANMLLAISFAFLAYISMGMADDQRIQFGWLVICTFMYTIGELYCSPIGLSLVTKVSPARFVSMMMGMWFLSSFFGNYLSGYLGTYYSTMTKSEFFMMLAILSVIASLAIYACKKPLEKALAH